MRKIEFVSYDGKYPNLCSGTLVFTVDGKEVYGDHCLISGGSAGVDFPDEGSPEEYCTTGEWSVAFDDTLIMRATGDGYLPEDYFNEQEKLWITHLVNENVEHGCCGGCI